MGFESSFFEQSATFQALMLRQQFLSDGAEMMHLDEIESIDIAEAKKRFNNGN